MGDACKEHPPSAGPAGPTTRASGPTAQDDATTPASPAVAVSARGGHVSERDKNNLRQAGQESPPVLAKSLLRTALACIRLDKDQRRNAVHKWYGESGLDGSNNTDNKARDALAKAVVVELALKPTESSPLPT
mmetsp:Transcript_17822/g.46676  ORF Transcript_17822/g.46676 Transcript_17822/m.46676 type:complete len:133 (-) Transcript_17822:38-436(-)